MNKFIIGSLNYKKIEIEACVNGFIITTEDYNGSKLIMANKEMLIGFLKNSIEEKSCDNK